MFAFAVYTSCILFARMFYWQIVTDRAFIRLSSGEFADIISKTFMEIWWSPLDWPLNTGY